MENGLAGTQDTLTEAEEESHALVAGSRSSPLLSGGPHTSVPRATPKGAALGSRSLYHQG